MTTTRLRLITNSELKTGRRCLREHRLAYQLGYRSAVDEAEALRFGTLLHLGLEAWWLASEGERLAAAFAVMAPRAIDEYDRARAEVMMQGYDARWSGEATEFDVLAVEVEFATPLVNPGTGAASRTFELGGKLDAIVRSRVDGLVYVLEHKTTGEDISAGSQYWQLLQLDTQISVYYVGARALGHEPAGVIYDVLAKPKLRPLKATPIEDRKYRKDGVLYANQRADDETPDAFRVRLIEAIAADPDRYYVRGHVVRLDDEEREGQFDTWQVSRLLREAELAERWPRNPDACKRWGRVCGYFGVCTGVESLDDTTLFTRVDNVHQELSRVVA